MSTFQEDQFNLWLQNEHNKSNNIIIQDNVFDEIITCIKTGKGCKKIKKRIRTNKYQLVSYVNLNIPEMLCVPSKKNHSLLGNYKQVVKSSCIFQIIKRIHGDVLQHSGVLKTFQMINIDHAHIPRSALEKFISNCEVCALKKVCSNSAPLKPIISTKLLERMQIDLIDMQTQPDGNYKFIGHIVDHFSKFRIFFPMETKSAEETAKNCIEKYFSIFGLPHIIHSDNGTEFVNDVLRAVAVLWPGKTSFEQGNNTLKEN